MMLDGFRSRWMMPLAWASAIARASCRTTAATARGGSCCTGADEPRERPALEVGHRQVEDAVDLADSRRPGRGSGGAAWRRPGPRGGTGRGVELLRPGEVRHLEGDEAVELRVVGEVDGPHAALAEQLEQLVAAEPGGQAVRQAARPRHRLAWRGGRIQARSEDGRRIRLRIGGRSWAVQAGGGPNPIIARAARGARRPAMRHSKNRRTGTRKLGRISGERKFFVAGNDVIPVVIEDMDSLGGVVGHTDDADTGLAVFADLDVNRLPTVARRADLEHDFGGDRQIIPRQRPRRNTGETIVRHVGSPHGVWIAFGDNTRVVRDDMS